MSAVYSVEEDVLNLAGNPKEFEFPLDHVHEIMASSDKIVNDFLPRIYTSDDEGYATIVRLANYIAAVEIRKQWYDIGNKIGQYLKEIESMKVEIAAGFPEDSSDGGTNILFSEMPPVDYIYYNRYVYGAPNS
ncbi:MAG: hypothetical protein R2685_10885 [Candidatus Nitrosocosmicus sp.]|nr:hypothetical protein [Candidatus Nitrosocosmicus sp.]